MLSRKLVALVCILSSIFCLAENVQFKLLLRKKRQGCENGIYEHEGKQCCSCPEGYHVVEHCTRQGGDPTCEVCAEGTYMPYKNGEEKCLICTICQATANKEIMQECSKHKNTVCRCKKDHYCENGNCDVCHACDICGGKEEMVPCNQTTNRVCKEEIDNADNTGAIVAGVCVPVFLIVVFLIGVMWKRKLLCFKNRQRQPKDLEKPLSLPLLPEADLGKHLLPISEVLGYKIVKDMSLRSVDKVKIENVEHDYPKAADQAYELLNVWYQQHGMKGAYKALIKTLHETGNKASADKVQSIVEKGL